jgi:beta-N-acetylhexosaminidase
MCALMPFTMAACSANVPSDSSDMAVAQSAPSDESLNRRSAPPASDESSYDKAVKAVDAMTLRERVGQLAMAPLYAGSDPSVLSDLIADWHVGSILLIGNWTSGVAGVAQAVATLQSYAPDGNKLLVTADQEGGLVQHLQGDGFDRMPSATDQGMMSLDQLRDSASVWGSQLKSAGVNIDLAPVVGTVTVSRDSNDPIGALDRDFGLDADGNAQHAKAFIQGMHDADVGSVIKHYPGLGAVTGNTDFTTDGILDTTTTLDGEQIKAFNSSLDADPAMVMMSLATYQAIDPSNPAVFSSALITDYLRGKVGFQGVVTSDSMSAAALGGFEPSDLGVRLVDAGGDLACIGDADYVQPILRGLYAKASSDSTFSNKVRQSAIRVMTLKYDMGLAK